MTADHDSAIYLFGIGAIIVGCCTIGFSLSRIAFVRFFVPHEKLKETLKALPKGATYTKAMFFIGGLQICMGLVVTLLGIFFR